jgi:hypothetical protein
VFGPTFRGEGVVRSDDITADPRYGHMPPHHGMPAGHMPVRSYLAVPVRSRRGEVLGGLFFGHERPGVFTEREERLVTAVAAWAAVAMDNARLYAAERRARAAAEAAAGRAERLRALAVALADAVTEAEVGARVMHDGVAAFGAYAGVIAVPVEGGAALEVTHSVGYPAAACMDVGRRWPTTLAIPIAEAYRTGTPVFVESPEAWAARYAQGTRGPSYRPPRRAGARPGRRCRSPAAATRAPSARAHPRRCAGCSSGPSTSRAPSTPPSARCSPGSRRSARRRSNAPACTRRRRRRAARPRRRTAPRATSSP